MAGSPEGAAQLRKQIVELGPVLVVGRKLAVLTGEGVLNRTIKKNQHHNPKQGRRTGMIYTSSKSSNFSRQFSQYPGLGSALVLALITVASRLRLDFCDAEASTFIDLSRLSCSRLLAFLASASAALATRSVDRRAMVGVFTEVLPIKCPATFLCSAWISLLTPVR